MIVLRGNALRQLLETLGQKARQQILVGCGVVLPGSARRRNRPRVHRSGRGAVCIRWAAVVGARATRPGALLGTDVLGESAYGEAQPSYFHVVRRISEQHGRLDNLRAE